MFVKLVSATEVYAISSPKTGTWSKVAVPPNENIQETMHIHTHGIGWAIHDTVYNRSKI